MGARVPVTTTVSTFDAALVAAFGAAVCAVALALNAHPVAAKAVANNFDEKYTGVLGREPIKYCITFLVKPSPPLGKLLLLKGRV